MIEQYLCQIYQCTLEDLKSDNILLTYSKQDNLIKVLAYQKATIITCSKQYVDLLKDLIQHKTRDQLFELPHVYGQTIHYRFAATVKLELPTWFEYALIEDTTNFVNFENAVDKNTKVAIVAKLNGQVVGIAGASLIEDALYEIGVDIVEDYQNQGLASCLVNQLAHWLINNNITPFYSASTTNLASQMVAYKSGFKPCWVDTFGFINDKHDIYAKIRK